MQPDVGPDLGLDDLAALLGDGLFYELTIKRCMPFLDALQVGWILPLAATVRLEVKDGGQTVDAGWEFDKVMVSNQAPF